MVSLYVGNMPFSAQERELRAAFEPFGEVASVRIATHRADGRPVGFAFVDMPDEQAAQRAAKQLNNTDLAGRIIRVSETRPRDNIAHI
ncbi:MAG: RNA-binding protein [Kiritimatiellae bacterium]|nr:RNA-binding protein [Kiritimatiellia bacterium]MCO5062404.1 RNA-binding protein [Kiritimatiellia bacterium]MCO6400620.1 RNA-binding protein [Verrucomicrobiota bacterium]